MKLAIASGKGGTGKTTVATSLAMAWAPTTLIDCDVEGPNADLLLNPQISELREVGTLIPVIDNDLCLRCGQCADFCRYHALAVVAEKWMLFKELCHSCGGCQIICPNAALREEKRTVGTIKKGQAGKISFFQGILGEGETQPVPLIEALLENLPESEEVILDSPPGASCSMISVARAADAVLLITEPTPFGLHDLKAATEALRELDRPMAVIINRADWGDDTVRKFCHHEAIPIAMEIPHYRRAAEAYARALPLIRSIPELQEDFQALRPFIRDLISRGHR